MVVVRLEHELVPVVRAEAEFQQLVQPFTLVVAVDLEQRPLEELRPVVLRGFDQDVGRGEEHVEGRQFRHQRREPPDIPEFAGPALDNPRCRGTGTRRR